MAKTQLLKELVDKDFRRVGRREFASQTDPELLRTVLLASAGYFTNTSRPEVRVVDLDHLDTEPRNSNQKGYAVFVKFGYN